jgi:hypothetical protein
VQTYATILICLGFAAVFALWRLIEQNRHIISRLDTLNHNLSTDITGLRNDAVDELRDIKSEIVALSATLSCPKTDA